MISVLEKVEKPKKEKVKFIYGWKNNLFKVDAQKIGNEIDKIKIKTPQNIVNKARNKNNELHKCFEWEDSIAAENYRKQQARMIMNDLIIVLEKEEKNGELKEIEFSAYESVKNEDGNREYINIIDGIKDEEKRQMILDEINTLLSQASYKLKKYNECVSLLMDEK